LLLKKKLNVLLLKNPLRLQRTYTHADK
jgi:hypothetical protein